MSKSPKRKRRTDGKKKPTQAKPGFVLIFRRYRTDPKTGEVLDAHEFGHEAWPMWIKR